MTTSEIATVLAWHDALNASDVATLVGLSSDDIEVGDAHGAAQGHAALREWAAAHPGKAEVGKIFVHDGVVVVEQKVGGPGESGAPIASAFRVVHDHVTSVFRHHDLAAALAATELTDADRVD
ncbi:MAG TPA: nuclear transport factor 2 family protein [Mycobacterium sp.]|jgi:ketosteroid isomerase-like protein|uniref:nuclear transport factor 2 family protein n=1 Tax=Mycobacterium sp. TaxID=1785 RepID=UPI002F406492